jgi:hypothetical protein
MPKFMNSLIDRIARNLSSSTAQEMRNLVQCPEKMEKILLRIRKGDPDYYFNTYLESKAIETFHSLANMTEMPVARGHSFRAVFKDTLPHIDNSYFYKAVRMPYVFAESFKSETFKNKVIEEVENFNTHTSRSLSNRTITVNDYVLAALILELNSKLGWYLERGMRIIIDPLANNPTQYAQIHSIYNLPSLSDIEEYFSAHNLVDRDVVLKFAENPNLDLSKEKWIENRNRYKFCDKMNFRLVLSNLTTKELRTYLHLLSSITRRKGKLPR